MSALPTEVTAQPLRLPLLRWGLSTPTSRTSFKLPRVPLMVSLLRSPLMQAGPLPLKLALLRLSPPLMMLLALADW